MPQLKDLDKIKSLPTSLVIFGATGDLARKRIFPALFKLYTSNLLPSKFKIVASARTPHQSEEFRRVVKEYIKPEIDSDWNNFSINIDYLSLDVAENKNLKELLAILEKFEVEIGTCIQRVYYMSISPDIFQSAVKNIGINELNEPCTHNSKPRIIIEKPFGRDLKSAQELDQTLSKYFSEDQIYRIDHYLGKETVQNIFAFRFGNEIFEPIWNNQYVDNIQITMGEYIGVEKRGVFYEKTGALRDIVQNHLLQLLALSTMDQPESFHAKSINAKKLEIIKSIKKMSADEITKNTVRAQYKGYTQEENVSETSQTETYALTKLELQHPRWTNVPVYLRAAKKMPGKITSIIFQFKEKGHKLLEDSDAQLPNTITLQIQPNEGIGIRLVAKKPGLTADFQPVDMEFCYKNTFDTPQPEAYERLMMDVILGDQSLFMSQEVIAESWKVIDPIEEAWAKGSPQLVTYKPGTWGPKEADDLIEKDGRQWLAPLLEVCKI